MTPITRRTAVRGAATLAGAGALGAAAAPAAQAARTEPGGADWTEAELRDRRRVLALGFTEEEADCWLLVARAGAAFFALPEIHPSDRPDVVDAIHVMQRILMQRPAYKRYREMGEAEEGPPPPTE
ncbi:hypothetical protein [Streptomyces mayteni]